MGFTLLSFLFFSGSCVFSLIITAFTIRIAHKIGFVDKPNKIVENHLTPVAYGGGAAIALTLIIAFIILNFIGFRTNYLLISIVPVILLGAADDIYRLKPSLKFILQCISVLPFLFFYDASLLIKIAAGFFMVASMNAWNLIDIMDGLTGTISVFAFAGITIVIILFIPSELSLLLVSVIIIASVLGFLAWNRSPARIFLGDTGSLLLGMLFPIFILELFRIDPGKFYLAFLPGSIPFFEILFLLVVRTKKGIPFYKGSPDHFALRMLHNGFKVKKIIRYIIIYSALQLVILILLSMLNGSFSITIFLLLLIIIFITAFRYFDSLPAREIK